MVTNCPYLKCVSIAPFPSLPPLFSFALARSLLLACSHFFFSVLVLVERTHAPSQPSQQLVPRALFTSTAPLRDLTADIFNFLKVRGGGGEQRGKGWSLRPTDLTL